jgi:2-polyprenyl-3-methyl-5-hydroxy-6-metoxy-1,4-benzoquinol methylase
MLKVIRQEKTPRQLTEERLENLWSQSPEMFDPSRNCREIERIERTWNLIRKIPHLEQKVVIDVGCGKGLIAKRLKNLGATVHVLDGSLIPLNNLQNEGITTIHDYLPKTKLKEGYYDIVICTDVIALLPPQEHRLLMLELSRIVKKEGFVVCSTGLDIHSEDALEIFQALLQTEFDIDECLLSYHALHIKIRNILKTLLLTPLSYLWRHNRRMLVLCEKLTKALNEDSGVSHAICIGKRRALF